MTARRTDGNEAIEILTIKDVHQPHEVGGRMGYVLTEPAIVISVKERDAILAALTRPASGATKEES